MNYLAIDFGLAKIGLAVSEGELAEPLTVVKNDPKAPKIIKNFCRDRQIEKIILGLPEGALGKKARAFGQKLAMLCRVPIAFQDETLTSRDALAKMVESGRRMKFRRDKEDAVAAAIILQNYLDSNT